MRILHVITVADLGGAQTVAAELAARSAEGGDIVGLATSEEGPLWATLDPRIERFPIRGLAKALSPLDDLGSFLEIRRVMRSFRPDLVHLHSSKAGVLGRLAAWRLRPRTIYTVHGFDTILKSHRAFLPLERLLQYACGAVVAVSEYDRGNLEANGIRRNLVMARNGVRDWKDAEPGDAAAAAKMRRARSEGRPVALCVARVAAPKRLDLFLKTAALLPEAAFFWIGNDADPSANNIPPNVTFLGSLAGAGAYNNLADANLLLSDYEGLPMSVLEALSCGTPAVASAVGGIAEALDGACGITVPNEAEAASKALRSLLYGPGKERARSAARARYEADFSIGAMFRRYSELYSRLAETS